MFALALASCILSLLTIVLLFVLRAKPAQAPDFNQHFDRLTQYLRADFKASREEAAGMAAQNRQELLAALQQFRTELSGTLNLLTEQQRTALDRSLRNFAERFTE
ncbi:MAG: hypothetical protein EOO11_18130, partial [Chitinophagaceae bacterium]